MDNKHFYYKLFVEDKKQIWECFEIADGLWFGDLIHFFFNLCGSNAVQILLFIT